MKNVLWTMFGKLRYVKKSHSEYQASVNVLTVDNSLFFLRFKSQ